MSEETISFGAGMMQMITKQLAPHFMPSYSLSFSMVDVICSACQLNAQFHLILFKNFNFTNPVVHNLL